MKILPRLWFTLCLVSLCCFSTVPSQSQSAADEAAVHAVVERFYQAWAAKNFDEWSRLWSAQAVGLETQKKNTQEFFASSASITLKDLTVRRVGWQADKVWVRVGCEVQVIDVRTNKERNGYGKRSRTLELVKEADGWKVAREFATADDLALKLVAMKEAERNVLLTEYSDLPEKELLEGLQAQAMQLRVQNKLDDAEVLFLLAQTRADAAGDGRVSIRARLMLGENFYRRANYDRALIIFQEAHKLAEAAGGQAEIAGALRSIGTIHEKRGNFSLALEHFQKALPMAQAANEKRFIGALHQDVGRIAIKGGEFQAARASFLRSLTIYEEIHEKVGQSSALNFLASIERRQGDFPAALRYTERQLQIAEEINSPLQITTALLELGNLKFMQGETIPAYAYYQRVQTLAEANKFTDLLAANLVNLANISQLQGDFTAALGYAQRSLALAREMNVPIRVAQAYMNLAVIYVEQGNLSRALEIYEQVRQIEEKLGRKPELAYCLGVTAMVHRLQGNYTLALELAQRSQSLHESAGLKFESAQNLNVIGDIHRERKDISKALTAYQQGLVLAQELSNKRLQGELQNSLANLYLLQRDYTAAREQFTQSLTVNEVSGAIYEQLRSHIGLGSVSYAQGRPAEALTQLERALPLMSKDAATEVRIGLYELAGRSHMALGNTDKARAELVQAVALIENLRAQAGGGEQTRQEFLSARVGVYHTLLALAQDQPHEALSWAERSKARVLLEVLQSGKADIYRTLTATEQQQERQLRADLAALNLRLTNATQATNADSAQIPNLKTRIEQARRNYEVFQASLYASHPELRTKRGESPIIKTAELAALLPDSNTALLEYVVTDDATYLFTVTMPTGKTAAEVQLYTVSMKSSELTQQIETFRQQLAARDLGFRTTATKLYDLLLKPAQSQLKGKTNFIVVPDGKLWELPFQALPMNTNRFLIEEAAISYAPSLTVLREMMKRQKSPTSASTLLALGNPTLGKEMVERATMALRDGKFEPLPEAESEVKAIGQLYGATRSKVFTRTAAREDRAKAEAATMRILHFATHGVMNNASPLYSHLVLANSEKEDGLLEAWELMQMDLQAELAVLSACETARGRYGAGEGMIGLSWALFVAGVPSTVVSQWKVESASTRDLMLRFHRGLQNGKTSKAEALRQASLSLLKQPATSHPFYWASFVLVGNPQ